MATLAQLIPEPKALAEMRPSELGGYLLEVLVGPHSPVQHGLVHARNFVGGVDRDYDYKGSRELQQEVANAISAAWNWLKVNGLICADLGGNDSFDRISRLGRQVAGREGVKRMLSDELLPTTFLHPALLSNSRPNFMRGHFDTSVFEAFKELEVAIRTASEFGPEKIGVPLVNAAFHPVTGPLTDTSLEGGERVALMNLMAGAIGSYKNPSSHRKVDVDRDEAREMILLASHLLKIVDARAAAMKEATRT